VTSAPRYNVEHYRVLGDCVPVRSWMQGTFVALTGLIIRGGNDANRHGDLRLLR